MPYNADGGTLTQSHLDTLKYMKYNSVTNQIESSKEIQTTLNSFFLGDQHKMSSGGENVFFTNLNSDVDWFPAWSGIKDQQLVGNQDETGVIPPSFRTYDNLETLLPYGQPHATDTVLYLRSHTTTANYSQYGIQFIIEEDIGPTDWLVYQVWFGTDETGIQAFEQKFTGDTHSAGDVVEWWFTHPIEGHAGETVLHTVKKYEGAEDGAKTTVTVREADTVAGAHYAEIYAREFENRDVMAGVHYLTDDHTIGHAGTYAVDTSSQVVNMTVNSAVGYKSFIVFDADKNFNTNACIVDFGAPQGTATLQSKNDSYMFYHDGTQWRFLDLNTKDGGIV